MSYIKRKPNKWKIVRYILYALLTIALLVYYFRYMPD